MRKKKVVLPRDWPSLHRTLGREESWGMVALCCKTTTAEQATRDWNAGRLWALNLVVSGTAWLRDTNGRSWRLEPGCAYQHRPDTDLRLEWDDGGQVTEWFLLGDKRLHERLSALGMIRKEPVWRFERTVVATGLFEDFYGRLGRLVPSAVPAHGRRVLLETVRFLEALQEATESHLGEGRWRAVVGAVRRELEERPESREPLSLLAARHSVSYSSLRQAFRAEVGVALGDYRIAQRIHHARVWLTHESVQATATKLGYADPFTFSAQFKQATGMSPREFQNQTCG